MEIENFGVELQNMYLVYLFAIDLTEYIVVFFCNCSIKSAEIDR